MFIGFIWASTRDSKWGIALMVLGSIVYVVLTAVELWRILMA
jgi:hypothetical protein